MHLYWIHEEGMAQIKDVSSCLKIQIEKFLKNSIFLSERSSLEVGSYNLKQAKNFSFRFELHLPTACHYRDSQVDNKGNSHHSVVDTPQVNIT